MIFISKKSFEERIVTEVREQIKIQMGKELANTRSIIEEIIKKKEKEQLKVLFDEWVNEALEQVRLCNYMDYTTRKSPSMVQKSLSATLEEVAHNLFKELVELLSFSNKEEFIDKVVERIRKKQIQ